MDVECRICKNKFKNLLLYNNHQSIHKHIPNSTFFCLEPKCGRQFKVYKNFYMHIYRTSGHLTQQSESFKFIKCKDTDCGFRTTSKLELSRHISNHIKSGKIIKCPIQCCNNSNRNFRCISTWRSHLFRFHCDFDIIKSSSNEYLENDVAVYKTEHADILDVNLSGSDVDKADNKENLESCYLKSLSFLYLTLQTKYFMSEKALNVLIESIRDFSEISNQNLINYLSKNFNIHISLDCLNEVNLFSRLHNNTDGILRTSFSRKEYYKREFRYIAPNFIKLGNRNNNQRGFYYVSILDTLKVIMQNNNVYRTWQSDALNISRENVFSNITDGLIFKSNQFFKENPRAFRIILFQDAFEVCNPLGSSRKKHKVVGIYMILGNIEPHYWSKVDNILLVALALQEDVDYFGIKAVFGRIVDDIKILETVGINVNGQIIKGTLFAMLGDNLGSHSIGGFIENFSTCQYVCRYCYARKEDFSNIFDKLHSRTKTCYENDCQIKMAINENNYKGVKEDSILNSLKYFHVCNPGLPPCIAHDVFEGIVQYDVMLAITYFVNQKWFSFDELNSKLQNLKVENCSDKVPLLKNKSHKLCGSAHQNIILIQILPFAVFDLVKNGDDSVWQMLLILRQICNIVLSVKLYIGQIAYLKSLIEEYLYFRIKLFPNTKLRPKHHYLLHYHKLILLFGPVRHLWTLRFEAKHKYFKNVIKHSPNFKNILLSMSEKHQLLQALQSSKEDLFSDKVCAENVILYNACDFSQEMCSVIWSNCTFEKPFFITKCISYKGIKYSENMYICCGKNMPSHFVLVKIFYILINNEYSDAFFVGYTLEVMYNKTSGLYYHSENGTTLEQQLVCVSYANLLHHEPLYVLNAREKLFYFKSTPFDEN